MRYEILVDRTERPKKCTILPLAYREDFHIVRFDRRYPIRPLAGSVLLHPDGDLLTTQGTARIERREGIVLSAIDCNWRRLDAIVGRIVGPLPPQVRIPDGFLTAYRRRNQRDLDPEGGLATIEALFLASAFLGVWDESLLKEYAMGAEFLAVNASLFEEHGIGPAHAARVPAPKAPSRPRLPCPGRCDNAEAPEGECDHAHSGAGPRAWQAGLG